MFAHHEPLAVLVSQNCAVAAKSLGQQRPRHARVVQRGRVELHELHVRDRHAGTHRHPDPVTGRNGRVRRHREELSGTTSGEDRVTSPDLHRPTGGVQCSDSHAPTVLHHEVDTEAALPNVDVGQGMRRIGQRAFDLRARRITTRVHHSRQRVTALDGERERSVLFVEPRAEFHEFSNATRSFGHEDVDRIGVAQAGSGDERVLLMQLGRVRIAEHRGHSTLRVPGGRRREFALGDDTDGPPALRRVDRGR